MNKICKNVGCAVTNYGVCMRCGAVYRSLFYEKSLEYFENWNKVEEHHG